MKNKSRSKEEHKPVLLKEVLEVLRPEEIAHLHSKAQFIDATLGYGGHSSEFIRKKVFVLGIDSDQEAINSAKKKLLQACPTPQNTEGCFRTVKGNFRDIDQIAKDHGLNNIYGILFDLGVSSPQLLSPDRGFSFQYPDADLDMRMDPESQAVTAADLLNSLPESHLYKMFNPYLEHHSAKKLAKEIVLRRDEVKFAKVSDLLGLLDNIQNKKTDIDKATLPFMALRIAVNTEISDIKAALPKAFSILKKSGRIAVISFHSEEDKIVKHFFNDLVMNEKATYPVQKLILPSEMEKKENPRARSAKLRVIEKL